MLSYQDFRTGYTFRDVYHFISNRKWKRRRGVLGYWRELKLKMYAEYVRTYAGEYVVGDSEVPP